MAALGFGAPPAGGLSAAIMSSMLRSCAGEQKREASYGSDIHQVAAR